MTSTAESLRKQAIALLIQAEKEDGKILCSVIHQDKYGETNHLFWIDEKLLNERDSGKLEEVVIAAIEKINGETFDDDTESVTVMSVDLQIDLTPCEVTTLEYVEDEPQTQDSPHP